MADEAKARGNAALSKKDYDTAIACYTEAIALNGSEHTFYSNRSAAYLSKGDAKNALVDGAKCIELKPSWAKGYNRKAAAEHALKKWEDAEATYEGGLVLCPGDASLVSGLADVKKAEAAEASRAGSPFAKAFGPDLIGRLAGHPTLSKKLSDPAFMMKLKMLQTNPSMVGQMFGDPDMQQVLSFAMGIDIMSPNDFGARSGAGGDEDESMDVDAPPRAAPAAAPVPVPEPEPEPELSAEEQKAVSGKAAAKAAKEQGNEHYKAKRFQEALACYDQAFAADSTDITFLNNKCAVYFELKEYETCIAQGRTAIETGKKTRTPFELMSKIYVRIGKARQKQGDDAGAIEEFKTAQMENYAKDTERLIKTLELEMKKKRVAAYVDPEKALEAKEKGNAAFRDGKFADAIADYEEAIKRDPKNPAYCNNLAAALSKIGDFQGAKRACEKALELDPKYVKAIAKKADIEFLSKEYHKALDSYKHGLTVDPTNSACKAGLAKTMTAINTSGTDTERSARAMADPEIQAILHDPTIRQVINDLSTGDAAAGQAAMNDPVIRAKIEKLIAAGVLQTK